MAGTSIIFPDAAPAQADVIATLWTPEGIAPQLVEEFVFGATAAESIANRAAPGTPGTLIGAPGIGARSITIAVASGAGVNTATVPSETDQTFVAVLKPSAAGGGIHASAGPFTGLLNGVNGNMLAFYNSQSGVGASIAEIEPPTTDKPIFVIGWGSQGSTGSIQLGLDGALSAVVAGTAAGGPRPTTAAVVGGSTYGQPGFEIWFAARVPAILTAAQRLAWYQALRRDGSAANSPLRTALY